MHAQRIPQRDVDECLFAIAQGDGLALERLYNLTSSAIYSYALSVVKNPDDAQDVLHDTFVKAYESAHNYTSCGKPMAWLLTIAKNLCYTVFRKKSRFADVPDEDIETRFSYDGINAEDKLTVEQLLNTLDENERQIVVLHAVSGLKHREIASMLNMPLATVLSKYNRAIKKLQKIFKD